MEPRLLCRWAMLRAKGRILPLLCWLASTAPLWGQAFRVPPADAAPDETVQVQIALESPAGKEPAALQWEATFPVRRLNAAGNPTAGSAAAGAGKSITCSGRWKKAPEIYAYACILAGGLKPLGNGTIAVMRFKVPLDAPKGPARIRVEGEGASADAKKIAVAAAEGDVVIR